MENIRKGALGIFIEFKKDSIIDPLVIRLDNEKLEIFKRALFEYNFYGEFTSEKYYLKICNLIPARKKLWTISVRDFPKHLLNLKIDSIVNFRVITV